MKHLLWFGVIAASFALSGCGDQQTGASKLQPSPKPLVPISISSVTHVTIDTYAESNLNQSAKHINISSLSTERKIIDEINSSKSVPLPVPGTIVVAPSVGPKSVSYKVTVWVKKSVPRVFNVASWGPTHDVVYNEDLSPGLSRNVLKKLSLSDTKQ